MGKPWLLIADEKHDVQLDTVKIHPVKFRELKCVKDGGSMFLIGREKSVCCRKVIADPSCAFDHMLMDAETRNFLKLASGNHAVSVQPLTAEHRARIEYALTQNVNIESLTKLVLNRDMKGARRLYRRKSSRKHCSRAARLSLAHSHLGSLLRELSRPSEPEFD
jgi:hypothetical protein